MAKLVPIEHHSLRLWIPFDDKHTSIESGNSYDSGIGRYPREGLGKKYSTPTEIKADTAHQDKFTLSTDGPSGIGGSLYITGTSGASSQGTWIELPSCDDINLGTHDFTISIWVKQDAGGRTGTDLPFVAAANGSTDQSWIYWSKEGEIRIARSDLTTTTLHAVAGYAPPGGHYDSKWHLITATWKENTGSNGKFYLYYDGALVDQGTPGATRPNRQGWTPSGRFLVNGDVDGAGDQDQHQKNISFSHLMVWAKALSSDQIMDLYKSARGPFAVRSGNASLPARITLQDRDNHVNSYPTVLRSGDPRQLGNISVKFDDTRTMIYASRYASTKFKLKSRPRDGSSMTIEDADGNFCVFEFQRGVIISSPRPSLKAFFPGGAVDTGRWAQLPKGAEAPEVRKESGYQDVPGSRPGNYAMVFKGAAVGESRGDHSPRRFETKHRYRGTRRPTGGRSPLLISYRWIKGEYEELGTDGLRLTEPPDDYNGPTGYGYPAGNQQEHLRLQYSHDGTVWQDIRVHRPAEVGEGKNVGWSTENVVMHDTGQPVYLRWAQLAATDKDHWAIDTIKITEAIGAASHATGTLSFKNPVASSGSYVQNGDSFTISVPGTPAESETFFFDTSTASNSIADRKIGIFDIVNGAYASGHVASVYTSKLTMFLREFYATGTIKTETNFDFWNNGQEPVNIPSGYHWPSFEFGDGWPDRSDPGLPDVFYANHERSQLYMIAKASEIYGSAVDYGNAWKVTIGTNAGGKMFFKDAANDGYFKGGLKEDSRQVIEVDLKGTRSRKVVRDRLVNAINDSYIKVKALPDIDGLGIVVKQQIPGPNGEKPIKFYGRTGIVTDLLVPNTTGSEGNHFNVNFTLQEDSTTQVAGLNRSLSDSFRLTEKGDLELLSNPYTAPTLSISSNRVRGSSDNAMHFSPAPEVPPFDDSRIDAAIDRDFYEGTPESVVPGFKSPLRSKKQIVIDITSNKSASIFFSTGTVGRTSDYANRTVALDAGINSGMAYFDVQNKKWDIQGNILSGANIDFLRNSAGIPFISEFVYKSERLYEVSGSFAPLFAFQSSEFAGTGSAAFDPSTKLTGSAGREFPYNGPGYSLLSTGTIKSAGHPVANFGFPFDARYHATSSYFIDMSQYISQPFLLEKIVLDFSGSFTSAPFDKSTSGPSCFNFFILNQIENIGGNDATLPEWYVGKRTFTHTHLEQYQITWQGTDPANGSPVFPEGVPELVSPRVFRYDVDVPHRITKEATPITKKVRPIRELVSYGIIGRVDDTDEEVPEIFHRDLNIPNTPVSGSSSNVITGSFKLEFPARMPMTAQSTGLLWGYGPDLPVGYFSAGSWLSAVFDGFRAKSQGYYEVLGNPFGGRTLMGIDNYSGRSMPGGISGSPHKLQMLAGESPTPGGNPKNDHPILIPDEFSKESPYLLMPGDKLILGCNIVHHGGQSEFDEAQRKVEIAAAEAKLTLFGSSIKNNKEHLDSLNQFLTSDAIHEDIRGEDITDQFQIDSRWAMAKSYISEHHGGVLFGVSGDRIDIRTGEQPSRRVHGTTAYDGSYSTTGSMLRGIKSFDPSETMIDSLMPRISDYAKMANNVRVVDPRKDGGWETQAGTDAPSRFDANFLVYDFRNEIGTFHQNTQHTRMGGRILVLSGNTNTVVISGSRVPDPDGVAGGVNKADNFRDVRNNRDSSGNQISTVLFNTASAMPYPYHSSFGKMGLKEPRRVKEERVGLTIARAEQTNEEIWGDYNDIKRALFMVGNNIAETNTSTRDGSAYYSQGITKQRTHGAQGFLYGISNIIPTNNSAVFRHDHYGFFRDMLEQRRDTRYAVDRSRLAFFRAGTIPPVVVRFVDPDNDITNPNLTWGSNLSPHATSSLPFFDETEEEILPEFHNRDKIEVDRLNTTYFTIED